MTLITISHLDHHAYISATEIQNLKLYGPNIFQTFCYIHRVQNMVQGKGLESFQSIIQCSLTENTLMIEDIHHPWKQIMLLPLKVPVQCVAQCCCVSEGWPPGEVYRRWGSRSEPLAAPREESSGQRERRQFCILRKTSQSPETQTHTQTNSQSSSR